MKTKNSKNIGVAAGLLLLFLVWTLAIQKIDVQVIGPHDSSVGFATLNSFFHMLTGVHMLIYIITDWSGFVPLLIALGFAILGLVQLIRRKSLFKVDANILVLGGFYIIVIGCYILFEVFTINYRPVLINGYLEASYPSSTTLMVLCIIPTAIMQFHRRIKNAQAHKIVNALLVVFMLFMVIGRLISGVHWLTDIMGGVFLSAGLVMLYVSVNEIINAQKR